MIFPPAVSSEGGAAYQIEKSVRFRASASASASRTPSVAGDRKKLAMRFRVKRGLLGILQVIASAGTASIDRFYFDTSNRLCLDVLGTTRLVTTPVFRDPSAWYVDVGFELDVANGTSASRAKILIDGSEVSSYSTDTRSSITNTDTNWNNTVVHYLGRDNSGNYFDGYMCDPVLADGSTSISYSYAGTVREPLRPSATYGTNGFYLPFSNGTSLSTLTADASGNGNNWTANNISLTAGANYDWMDDTPTNTFVVLNEIFLASSATQKTNISYAGLRAVNPTTTAQAHRSGFVFPSSGKFYFEFTAPTYRDIWTSGIYNGVGGAGNQLIVIRSNAVGNGVYNGASLLTSFTPADGDIFGFAVDLDSSIVRVYRNNVLAHTSTGFNAAGFFVYGSQGTTASTTEYNFGQRPFAYTPPTGFLAICSKNLAVPTIGDGSSHFDVVLSTGANIKATAETVFPSNFLEWIKDRANSNNHQLIDTVRGTSAVLQSNTTAAETTYTAPSGSSVAWVWKAGGAPVSNTDGSITSQVSANTTAGFSVVTYTGDGVANASVGHGLGATPKLAFVKRRTGGTGNWLAYTSAVDGTQDYLLLNSTAAKGDASSSLPTSSLIYLGGSTDDNANGSTYVAHCFAEVEGFSKMGSYTGNGSTDGPFIYCGFKPRWIMLKRADTTGSWYIYDAARSDSNVVGLQLFPNTTAAEATSNTFDFLSNGVKFRNNPTDLNASGGTYIFMAFAEHPFKYARAR